MDALAFFGAFALPLLGSEAVPAALALALVFLPRGKKAFRLEVLAAALGWLASWFWRFESVHLEKLVDLALVGPALAFGAANRSGRSFRDGLLAGGAVCGLAALGQAFLGRVMPFHWAGADWPWGRAAGTLGNPNVAGAYL
ncbi:MAG: hypothetical protein K6U03_04135, partial [Firmicutes bacterium]|nr:hypothetical protein [Bacillota bacterium]